MTRQEAENLLADVLIAKHKYEHLWAISKDENSRAVKDADEEWKAQRERLLVALTTKSGSRAKRLYNDIDIYFKEQK